MPITTYGDLLDGDNLFAGVLATLEDAIIRSGINADSVVIPFGMAVCAGSAAGDLILPANANSIFLGVAHYNDAIEKRASYSLDASGRFGVPVDYQMGYVRRGVVGVLLGGTVTPASPVYWVHTTNSTSVKGSFRADADTANAVLVSAAKFIKGGAAGEVGILELNLP